MKIFVILALLFSLFIGAFFYDASELLPESRTFYLLDKWHEESCSPIFDDKGNYLGETCSDDWTLVVMENGERKTLNVSGNVFTSFVIGDTLNLSYDKGKLGFRHHEKWAKTMA